MNQKQKELFDRIDKSLNEALHLCKGIILIDNKEQCNHEPKVFDARFYYESLGGAGTSSSIPMLEQKCKHCGVKIKAEKWVEG